jgi:predicted MPP superfamily phosphohydrolase
VRPCAAHRLDVSPVHDILNKLSPASHKAICKDQLAKLPINRRTFLRLTAATAATGVAAIGGDATLLEPNRPRIVRKGLSLRRWPARLDGFTIVVLSDFHYDPHFSIHPLHASIGMVNALRPDLIVLTGDFVTAPLGGGDDEKAASTAEPCARLLRQMHARHGSWAVLGNHDYATDRERVASALQAEGIHCLANQSIAVERDGARFWLAGVDDVLSEAADLPKALHSIPGDEATVLLVHEPDYADAVAKFPVDLQLSGHSHGGQIRLPWLGPLYLPELARKYVWGLYQLGGLALYTNPGLGTMGLPVRWNCPPEITLLTLNRFSIT